MPLNYTLVQIFAKQTITGRAHDDILNGSRGRKKSQEHLTLQMWNNIQFSATEPLPYIGI